MDQFGVEVLVYLTAKVIHIDIDYICISIKIFIPYMLQKGEAASSKLLLPTTLIFVGVMIVVIAAAVGLLLG